MMNAYNVDPTQPNLYEETVTTTSLADVWLELAKEKSEELTHRVLALHETSTSIFISVSMDLKEQQHALYTDSAHKKYTQHEAIILQDKHNTLKVQI
ncbi:hypothetical protein EW146_g6145 [Bondarzewia mesenterica]|uniref:Uncharacterized protein n=1 Tax=Bondarzewia mesenterica TaxID=1095465 RepID=A0A4S4LPE7_9AGAM|nr:hypothetical protein EW146_g6145 [Bondarzewia mesenterica]